MHHRDHGSNYMLIVYTNRVAELGATPSAETVTGLYKAELIRQLGRWKTVEQVELPTLKHMWWWNSELLHGELEMPTTAEVEAAYFAGTEPMPALSR